MYDRIPPKFDSQSVGMVSYGPSHKIITHIVKYRTHHNQLRWFGDIRMHMYSATKKNFYASKKGITFNQEITLGLMNSLIGLPDDVPDIKPGVQTEIKRFQRYPEIFVVLSVVNIDNDIKIDIREWVVNGKNGYTGFSTKGIRFSYNLKNDISGALMVMHNKMIDLEKDILTKKKK